LIDLLVRAREEYRWPFSDSAHDSQVTIIELEALVRDWFLKDLTPQNALGIICHVSMWGRNNVTAQLAIENADDDTKQRMADAIALLSSNVGLALDRLTEIPGMGFVMATKTYRFRHASYFFNSLEVRQPDGSVRKATNFRREWSNGRHTTSRVAAFRARSLAQNRDEYIRVDAYLPFLSGLAGWLNSEGITFTCAATGEAKLWRPADIEMAAFYWWAQNGAR
jgi:hypothetical protein